MQAQIQVAQADAASRRAEAETNRQEAIWRHEDKVKELTDKDLRERTKMELEFQKNVPGSEV